MGTVFHPIAIEGLTGLSIMVQVFGASSPHYWTLLNATPSPTDWPRAPEEEEDGGPL